MSGIKDLDVLLKNMKPILDEKEYVFCTKKIFEIDEEIVLLKPLATFIEEEGMTLILEKKQADEKNLKYDSVFSKITLEVHSSLEAVGLTAVFSSALAKENISANVVAGFYHDHIFVQKDKALLALEKLQSLSK